MSESSHILTTENVARVPRRFAFPVRARGPLLIEAVAPSGLVYTMLVGGVRPLGGEVEGESFPGLTMRHGRVIMRMIYNRPFNSPSLNVELADLGRIGFGRPTGETHRNLKTIIEELAQAWVHVVEPGQAVRSVRLMNFEGKIALKTGTDASDALASTCEKNIHSRGVRKVTFCPEFWRACLNYQCSWAVRADVVDSMTSDLAAYAYMQLGPNTFNPQRPVGHRFLRDARELMREAGLVVDSLCRIREGFERSRGKTPSVLAQMNGAEMNTDRFRCELALEPSADGESLNIVYWREPADRALQKNLAAAEPTGEMFEFWKKETGAATGFYEAANRDDAMLLGHEIELMRSIGYHWEPHQKFLERARSFIGGIEFDTVLHSVKLAQNDAAVSGKAIGDLGKYVGGALMSAYKERVRGIAEARQGRR